MKKIILLFYLFNIIQLNAQEINSMLTKKKPCFEKAQAKKGQRFIEWECGKIPGIIDCNEKLDLDPGNSIVYSKGSGAPYTGMCETCHINGIIERRVTFVNGRENGIDTAYYQSGCPMVIRNHIQGAENGTWTYFYDSTQFLAWEMNYFAGQKHGKHIYFTKKGDTTLWENYSYDVLDGIKRTYYSKSRKHQEISYKKGILEGQHLIYNKEGVVIEKVNYKAGKKEGEATYFYDDGKLLRTENWSKGVKNGEFKSFYYQGFVESIESYQKGIKNGRFEEYFYDQKIKRKAVYKDNILIFEQIYDEQGILKSSIGVQDNKGKEDDKLPEDKKKKKKEKFVKRS
ncbi:MAG: toxin-antitoxin system YwqK family antitoxin [Flavobacteriia bacterium]|nr:toxin-antitoxin system YwqK family antitoxin [Flavobacteriia bacterium]